MFSCQPLMRRRNDAIALTAVLFLAASTLLIGFRYYSHASTLDNTIFGFGSSNSSQAIDDSQSSPDGDPRLENANATLLEAAPAYIKSIMTPDNTSFRKLSCPVPTGSRYDYLRLNVTKTADASTPLKYFFALDLHQCIEVLPRLLGSIIETIRFLGPENCALSIVEGRSDDGTLEVLTLMTEQLEGVGAKYFFVSSDTDPYAYSDNKNDDSRVRALSQLRNLAIAPLVDHPTDYSPETAIIFLNDVALCMEDILELIHQRLFQSADMTCAMDWTYVGPDPTFYDVWVARGMNGDSFFEIPADGNWDFAWNLFWNNPLARERLDAAQPFQVFSCWNGATVFTAKPFLDGTIKFRGKYEKECTQGEPQLLCKDMWFHGYGKIAVVPAVNLEYSNEAAEKIKALKGYVSGLVNNNSVQIDWEPAPPLEVKCIPLYTNQTWVSWDEQLKEHQLSG